MDPPGSQSLPTCIKGAFIMVYLLGFTRCAGTDPNCSCSAIPHWPKALTPDCSHVIVTYRYRCIDGYVRKAGTSNLIRCLPNNEWSKPSLECIVNPLAEKTSTTQRTSTTLSAATSTPSFSTVSSETEYSELSSTVLPPQHSSEETLETTPLPQENSTFPTSPLAPSVSSGMKSLELNSTALPPQHFPDTPNALIVSSSAPLTPRRSYATSSLSTSTTTSKPSLLDWITPSSSSSLNSTLSMQQEAHAVATEVIVPVAVVGVIALALVGALWVLHRRKSRHSLERNHNERHETEETVPMTQREMT